MRTFSERNGYKPVQDVLQVESITPALRNSLWNVLQITVWGASDFLYVQYGQPGIDDFSKRLWAFYFKLPIDTRPSYRGSLDTDETMKYIRDHFFKCEWHEVYSFLEFVVRNTKDSHRKLPDYLNSVLQTETAGYRFIDGLAALVTSPLEVESLKEALSETRFKGVNQHLSRALELLSDRANPDYRNSIKESISAVESMARQATGNPNAKFADALKTLERDGNMHSSLSSGYTKIYGYTSDADGIRHAILEKSSLSQAEAKYFLVSCSAFVNYMKANMV